jgi:hypothetical protein
MRTERWELRGVAGTALTWTVGWAVSAGALVSASFPVAGVQIFFRETVRPTGAQPFVRRQLWNL